MVPRPVECRALAFIASGFMQSFNFEDTAVLSCCHCRNCWGRRRLLQRRPQQRPFHPRLVLMLTYRPQTPHPWQRAQRLLLQWSGQRAPKPHRQWAPGRPFQMSCQGDPGPRRHGHQPKGSSQRNKRPLSQSSKLCCVESLFFFFFNTKRCGTAHFAASFERYCAL